MNSAPSRPWLGRLLPTPRVGEAVARLWAGFRPRALAARVDGGVLALLLLPVVLFAADPNWIFTISGHLDAWIYYGYYVDLGEHLRTYHDSYYAGRPSVIFPGYVAHKWFKPVAAHYVLHLSLYYASVLSVYGTLRHAVSRRTAFTAAGLMGGYYWFRVSIGSDYVDSFGMTYFLVATWAFARANRSARWWVWMFVGGGALACLPSANLHYLMLVPFPPLVYLVHNRAVRGHRWWAGAAVAAAGFAAAVLAFGLIFHQICGRFWYFMPSVTFVESVIDKPENPWNPPGDIWSWGYWKNATFLVATVVATAGAAFGLVATAWERSAGGRWAWAFNAQLVAMALMFVGMEASRKSHVLSMHYYASLLIPAAFLSLGAQLDRAVGRINIGRREFAVLAGLGLLALAANWFGAVAAKEVPIGSWPGVVSSGICGLVAVALFRVPHPAAAVAGLLALLLCLGDVAVRANHWQMDSMVVHEHKGNRNKPEFVLYGLHRRDEMLAASEAYQAIRSAGPPNNTYIWFDFAEPLYPVYVDVAGANMYGYRLVGTKFPDLTHDSTPHKVVWLKNGTVTRLAVLSADPLAHDKAVTTLRAAGVDVRKMVWYQKIDHGAIWFQVIIFELAPVPAPAAP